MSEILSSCGQSCSFRHQVLGKGGLPGEVVEEVMEEDHGNDTLAIAQVAGILRTTSGQSNPGGEGAAHSTTRNQEKWTTTKAIHHTSPEPGLEHVGHQNEGVE